MSFAHTDRAVQQAATLYASHWSAVVDVAARRLGNLEEAEAVAQEALLRALEASERGPVQNFRALAMRIAINLTVDTQRKSEWRARREDPELHEGPELLVDASARLEDLELLAHIREAVDHLDSDHRQIVELRYTEGRSFADIAQMLGMSKNGVFARHERALSTLRSMFARKGIP